MLLCTVACGDPPDDVVLSPRGDAGPTPMDQRGPDITGTMQTSMGEAADSENVRRWQAVCGALAAECGFENDCERQARCYDAWFRPEVFDAYIDCRDERACDGNDSDCSYFAYSMARSADAVAVGEECRNLESSCGGFNGGAFCFDWFFGMVRTELLPAYRECLTRPCDEVGPCVDRLRPPDC